jgi:hypothetical protein
VTIRSAVMGPLDSARLHGFETAVSELMDRSFTLRRRDLLYGSMIQAGVDQIKLVLADETTSPVSELLRARIKAPKKADPMWGRCFILVHEAFEANRKTSQAQAIPPEFLFLVDLLYTMHRRQNMISFVGFPSPNAIRLLPAELALPIASLLQEFQNLSPSLPNLRSAELADVARFESVLASTMFVDYERASLAIEDNNHSLTRTLEGIRPTVERLVSKNERLLRSKQVPLLLLSITAKLIDGVFGALPGKLAGVAADLAKPFLVDGRRLVIYDFSKTLRESYLTGLA